MSPDDTELIRQLVEGLGALALVVLLIFVALYFLPTIIAFTEGHEHKGAIFFYNIFLGWTVVGWIVLAIWAIQKAPQTIKVIGLPKFLPIPADPGLLPEKIEPPPLKPPPLKMDSSSSKLETGTR